MESKMDVWVSTHSFVDACLAEKTFDGALLKNLKLFLFSGETLTNATACRLLKRFPKAVIVNRDEAESATSAGLLIASTSKEKPQTGIVVAVGEGKLDKDGKLVPVPVKAGDRVLYGKYGGTDITLDGEEVLILRADDILAVYTA